MRMETYKQFKKDLCGLHTNAYHPIWMEFTAHWQRQH